MMIAKLKYCIIIIYEVFLVRITELFCFYHQCTGGNQYAINSDNEPVLYIIESRHVISNNEAI